MGCTGTPRAARLVARHRDRSLPRGPYYLGPIVRLPVCIPRRTLSRMTTVDGRSPGSRLTIFVAFPGPESQWLNDENTPLTVAGTATG